MTFVPPGVVSGLEALPVSVCPYCRAGADLCALHALTAGCVVCGGEIAEPLAELGSPACHGCRDGGGLAHNLS